MPQVFRFGIVDQCEQIGPFVNRISHPSATRCLHGESCGQTPPMGCHRIFKKPGFQHNPRKAFIPAGLKKCATVLQQGQFFKFTDQAEINDAGAGIVVRTFSRSGQNQFHGRLRHPVLKLFEGLQQKFHVFGGIAPTNLRPSLGSRPATELIGAIDSGIYIESCVLSPNPVTGEISATVDWAMKIEGGELAYPVTGIAISANVLELLDGLQEISSDCREEPGALMPTMRFKRVGVAGTA